VLLAMAEPDEEKRVFQLGWSVWRRAHQAVAARCKKASRATKRALGRERPSGSDAGEPRTTAIAPEEAPLTDEEWEMVEPLIPQRPPAGRTYNDHRTVLGGILWVARTGSSWREMPEEFGKLGDRLPALRAVVKARSLAAHPCSVGRRGVTGTGDQRVLNDAVGGFLGSWTSAKLRDRRLRASWAGLRLLRRRDGRVYVEAGPGDFAYTSLRTWRTSWWAARLATSRSSTSLAATPQKR
jgi:hypothetical protein